MQVEVQSTVLADVLPLGRALACVCTRPGRQVVLPTRMVRILTEHHDGFCGRRFCTQEPGLTTFGHRRSLQRRMCPTACVMIGSILACSIPMGHGKTALSGPKATPLPTADKLRHLQGQPQRTCFGLGGEGAKERRRSPELVRDLEDLETANTVNLSELSVFLQRKAP